MIYIHRSAMHRVLRYTRLPLFVNLEVWFEGELNRSFTYQSTTIFVVAISIKVNAGFTVDQSKLFIKFTFITTTSCEGTKFKHIQRWNELRSPGRSSLEIRSSLANKFLPFCRSEFFSGLCRLSRQKIIFIKENFSFNYDENNAFVIFFMPVYLFINIVRWRGYSWNNDTTEVI